MGSEHGPLYFELNTGAKMPSIGLGTWRAEPGLLAQAVITAVKAGYRHIDCATAYDNEKEIGEALNQLLTSGVVKRDELWITSKLWSSDHAPEDVPKGLDRTLKYLQLDYLDLYLIHWPIRTKPGTLRFKPDHILLEKPNLEETWHAMEAVYESGKAKAIGVSNYSVKKLKDLLGYAKVTPAVIQVECHLGWRQAELHKVCKETGVHLAAYSPLGSPGTWMKGDILLEPLLTEIAGKLNKSPAQVALCWGIQCGHSILVKSTNENRIKENLNIFDWSIPEDLFAKLSSEIPQKRLLRAEFILIEGSPWTNLEEFWDGEI